MKIDCMNDNGTLTIALDGRLDTTTAPELEKFFSENCAKVTALVLDCEKLLVCKLSCLFGSNLYMINYTCSGVSYMYCDYDTAVLVQVISSESEYVFVRKAYGEAAVIRIEGSIAFKGYAAGNAVLIDIAAEKIFETGVILIFEKSVKSIQTVS